MQFCAEKVLKENDAVACSDLVEDLPRPVCFRRCDDPEVSSASEDEEGAPLGPWDTEKWEIMESRTITPADEVEPPRGVKRGYRTVFVPMQRTKGFPGV